MGYVASKTHRTDEDFLALTGLPSPAQLVLVEMLSLLCRILATGARSLKATIAAAENGNTKGPRSWLHGVCIQLDRLICERGALSELHDLSFPGICPAITADPRTL